MSYDAVPAGTIVVWSDVTCPWASLAVHRLHESRERLGLVEAVRLDHRVFPLELVNGRATPKPTLDAEISVVCSHEPALGWRMWSRPVHEWPGSVLLALEAVQAAKSEQVGGLVASEQLDRALRRAFFAESRPIGLLTEVLAIAGECPAVDEKALEEALSSGAARSAVIRDWREHESWGVQGSPHLYLPDGHNAHNPGIKLEWTDRDGRELPVITEDDPAVYDVLLERATRPAGDPAR